MAADYDTAVYVEQGGAKLVAASGGEIEIQSGATLDLQSGATLSASDGMSFGTLSSTAQTGVALSSTDASVFNVFADDNNVALTNAVYHAIRGRTMLFKTPTEGSIFSVMGQIKAADEVDFNPGVFAGVRGYIETMDDTDVKSGAKLWAVDGCLDAALASYTVKDGGISAAFHAELTGAGAFVQDSGGILAGLYIDETATTGQWGYGIYIAKGAAARPIQIGALSSATQLGHTFVATTGYEAVRVYTDDGNVALTGGDPFVGIHSRSMFFQDQAGSTTCIGVFGQQKYASGVDIGQARTAAVEGYHEFMTTNLVKNLGFVAGLSSQTEISAGTLTVESGGILAGVHARLTGSGTAAVTGTGILAGVYIDESVTSGKWGYGIYMPGTAVTMGITVGTFSASTAGSGVTVASAIPRAVGFYADDNGVGTAGAVFISVMRGRLLCTGAAYVGEQYGLHGTVTYKPAASAALSSYTAGVLGTFEGATAMTVPSGFHGGMIARVGFGAMQPAISAGAYIAGVIAGNNMAAAASGSGKTAAFVATAFGAIDWDYGLKIIDSTCATGIDIDSCTTGIEMAGTYADNGINMQGATPNTSDVDKSLVRIGGYTNPLELSSAITANTFIQSIHIDSQVNPGSAKWLAGLYSKIKITSADQGYTQAVPVMIRGDIAKPCASFYGVQSHVKFSGTNSDTGDVSTEVIALSAQTYGTAKTGTGLHWGVKSDLRATNTPSGAGHTSACFFGVGTVSCSAGLYIEPQATTTMYSGVYLQAAGDMTHAIEIGGSANVGYLFKFDAASSVIVADTGDPGGGGTGGTAQATHKIKCLVGETTFYLAGWADF